MVTLLKRTNGIQQLDEGSTGQTELNRDRLLDEIMINYPVSFDEQNAIVGTLESIDRKLIVNKEINNNLNNQELNDNLADLTDKRYIKGGSAMTFWQ